MVVDLCAYPDAGIVEDLYLERLRAGKPIARRDADPLPPAAWTTARSRSERLAEEDLELPRINYGRCNERPYRYVWGIGDGPSGWLERIVKVDIERRHDASLVGARLLPGRAGVRGATRRRGRGRRRAAVGRARRRRGTLVPARARRGRPAASWRGPRSRTTSRSASTGSSRRAGERLSTSPQPARAAASASRRRPTRRSRRAGRGGQRVVAADLIQRRALGRRAPGAGARRRRAARGRAWCRGSCRPGG